MAICYFDMFAGIDDFSSGLTAVVACIYATFFVFKYIYIPYFYTNERTEINEQSEKYSFFIPAGRII